MPWPYNEAIAMSQLTTHILDLTTGRPASFVRIELFHEGKLLKETETNRDGRTDQPLLLGEHFRDGSYDLVFHIGAYFRDKKLEVSMPAFLEEVVVRFGLDTSMGKYHVPLLVSPYGYSTYRGS